MSEAWLARLEAELGAEALGSERECPGGVELPAVTPDSEEGFGAVLRVAAEEGLAILPRGLGSKATWTRPAERVDLVVSTRRYGGLVSYEPGDGTVNARAGTTLDALSTAVQAEGHRLTPDVPVPAGATLGGVLAAGQSGFDRLRYGPARHSVLGMRVLLADGSVTRSGGQLVKNVTGYDLHRLYCGSAGTLALMLEAALRLYPLPEALCALRRPCADRAEALERALALHRLALRPLAIWAQDYDGSWSTQIALTGHPEVVAHERDLALGVLGDAEEWTGDAARSHTAAERDRVLSDGEWPALELQARPTNLAATLAGVERAADGLGTAPRILAHPGVAQAFVTLEGIDANTAAALHGALEGLPARAVWRAAPLELRRSIDLWGSRSVGLPLMGGLRAALDPAGRFAAGRFHGGL